MYNVNDCKVLNLNFAQIVKFSALLSIKLLNTDTILLIRFCKYDMMI